VGGPIRSPASPITGINVTPLVDITLVLLIIFMVTAKLIVSHKALSVDLPKAASGSEVQEVFSIVLSAEGRTQVNGAALQSDDQIFPLAEAGQSASKELRVVIAADAAVAHGRVMHVLDLLKRAGVSKIAFGVAPLPVAGASDGNAVLP
jgi:biopolymer transport protein ExbD